MCKEADVDREPLDLWGRVEAVARQIDTLRAELESHRAEARVEVSTQRLVIKTADGFARIVLVAEDDSGHIVVRARSPEAVTGAELFVRDASPDGAPQAGFALTDQGDVVASFDLVAGEDVDLWVDEALASGEDLNLIGGRLARPAT
jgi:hypothetical protein